MRRGDAAVTAFSGARQMGEVPPDLHPLDLTFIDTNGAALQVFDLTALGGAATGQVANAATKFQVTAGEIGQVFGVALDGDTANATPNIYVTSTSLFGLQLVSTEGDRLVKGEPGARWMPGQFGLTKGGTPGSVWKIDGATGFISLFANIKHDGNDNAGPGLGDIAYDATSHQFFVSDLETGLIYRLDLDGNELGTFDHGTAGRAKAGLEPVAYDASKRMSIESPDFDIEKPSTWGFADKRRQVFAVAVQDGRLYYSVAESPQIWSVGLNQDGSFADDARLEIDVTGTPNGNLITDIAFDGAGALYLAQRGELVGSYDYSVFAKPEASAVLRYVWNETEQRWSTEAEEFAVGLKAPHRSTEGGIALSYGYNDGHIDYDQCRATLWTTGEHLREGEESDRVYQGGARIIHGLQGNDKGLVRPENEPPFGAWYVDNDGLYLDANVYGHVGGIAIFDPCDKRTIAESEPLPYPLPFPYYPPLPEPEEHVGPGIFIDKICEPAIFGGEIHCTITVTNIGETLSDAIDIWDAATILSGPGAGGGVIVAGVAPDGPDWICSPTPTPDLWCSLPPDAIEPGETRSIDVWIDTGPLFAAGDFGFRNCAVLAAPWDDIACDDGGTDITVTKTAPAACMPGADCTFTVTITNNGTLGFSGPVLLSDVMFSLPGGVAGAPIVIAPPLGCAAPPAAIPFSCEATLTLAPGGSITFTMTVTMPAVPAAYWAYNCFVVSAPGLPVPPLPVPLPPGAEPGAPISCAWVPVGGPPPLSNIRVEKTALNGGECYKLFPGDDIHCDYEIEFINTGPSPFGAVLNFEDVIPPAATITAFPPGWVCFGGPPATCGWAPPPIPPGGSVTAPITVTIPLAALEAAGCTMPNTATLTAPLAGGPDNFFGGDDTDTAEADAWLEWWTPAGLLVTCDPNNLKLTKVADGDCVASAGGYRCDYTIKVTNEGPDPFTGNIKIDDTFGFAPSSVTFPGWGHTVDGETHHLTRAGVHLEKGESIELKVAATVPEGKQCELKNTAVLTLPEAPTRWNNIVGDDAATAWAKIPSKHCVKPDRPQCEPKANEIRSESGACVCKSGYVRDEKGQCAGLTEPPVTEPQLCPDGKPVPKSGRCPEAPPLCEPGPNEERNAQGQCVCKSGYERDKSGRCVAPPTPPEACVPGPNELRNAQGQCVCKPGYERDRYGRCVKPETPPEACVPGPNELRNAQGQCVCKQGYQRDKSGRCVAPPTPPEACGPNELRDAQGKCVCKSGYQRDKSGRCVAPPTPPEVCGPNELRDAQGQCVCKQGYERDKYGRCVKPSDPPRECKAKGWFWDGKRCLSPADVCKLKKGVWDGKRCLSQADLCKAKGGKWDGERCLPATNPADECKKKGWVWNDKRKTCTAPLSPADECKKKGWKWDGKRCLPPIDPAALCKAKGWVWDGKRCQPPASTIPRLNVVPGPSTVPQ